MNFSGVCHWCSYHILTSSVIYYWTDARQHGIYLLNRFYVVAHLFNNRSQKTSKCGKNISDTRLKNSQILWHTLVMAYVNIFCFYHILVLSVIYSGQEKTRSGCLRHWSKFALRQVKIEVQWPGGQVKLPCSLSSLVSLNENVSLTNDNFQSEAISKLKTTRLVNHWV